MFFLNLPCNYMVLKERPHNKEFFFNILISPLQLKKIVFTESALRPIQSISRDVRLSVCLCVCLFVCGSHPRNHASRRIRDLWSKGVSLILAYL